MRGYRHADALIPCNRFAFKGVLPTAMSENTMNRLTRLFRTGLDALASLVGYPPTMREALEGRLIH